MATKFLKYFSKNIAIATIILSSSFSNSYAISDDECAIWLCAPAGFGPSECGPAHRAMIRRVHRGQGPLPPFSLCNKHSSNSNISNTEMTSVDGYAAYIP